MQTMLVGLGSGGRTFTLPSGAPLPLRAASSSFPRYRSKRSITPLISCCGVRCGTSLTASDTSTTVSPFSTPSLKSSKKSSFMGDPHSLLLNRICSPPSGDLLPVSVDGDPCAAWTVLQPASRRRVLCLGRLPLRHQDAL